MARFPLVRRHRIRNGAGKSTTVWILGKPTALNSCGFQ
jgi:hypothetical protein